MKIAESNNMCVFFLEGRVDSNNAPQLEEEIFEVLDRRQNDAAPIFFDAEHLLYISSAGLRALLKVMKKYDRPVKVVNVSREVYEIFDTTGFTELMEVRKAFRRVSVEGMNLIGRGMFGSVYRADDETVIKVFTPNSNFNLMIAQENQKAKNAFISGVPTAIPYDIVQVGNCYGTVYEMLNAKDLVTVMAEDKAHMDDYIRLFADTVKEMHTIKVSPEKFQQQKTAAIRALPYLSSMMSEEETNKVRALYENIPDRSTFIHGDCHIGNAMLQEGQLMFIDLATAGMGHPIFDMTSMHSLFCERANDPQAIAASPVLKHFTREELFHIWDVFLRTYLSTDNAALLKKAERQIGALSLARRLFMLIAIPGSLTPEEFAAMKQAIIDYCDQGLEPICF